MTTTNPSPFNPNDLTLAEDEAVEMYARVNCDEDAISAIGYVTDQFPAGALRPEFIAWLTS